MRIQSFLSPVPLTRRPRTGPSTRSRCSALAALPLLLLVACDPSPKPDGDGEAATEGPKTATITYAVGFECVNELLQPLTPIHNGLTYYGLYEPLAQEGTDYSEGRPTFHPRLAERWEPSEDGLAVTYFLRQSVTWSDGEPVTAEDVRFTWQAQVDPSVAWPYVEVKKKIRDVEVVDDHTVRFHFTENYPQQVFDSAQGVILPSHAWSERPFEAWSEGCEWFNERPVTSGPFRLDSMQTGQRVVLVKNPDYYLDGAPGLDRLVVEVVPERANRLAALRSGDSQFLEFVDYPDAAVLEADPEIELGVYVPRNYYFVSWNNTRAPFDSPAVRKALTLAIDRQEIIDSFFYGYGKVSHSPLASDIWAHNSDLEPWPYDPGQAKEILAAEGFTDTDGDGILDRDGEPFRFELMTNSENNLRMQIMVMIQSQLKRIGVDVATRTMDFRSLIEPMVKQDYDAAVSGLSISTDLDLSYNFHTRGIDPNALNWAAFSDPETDRLIDAANAELDYTKRKALYDQIQVRLHELQPVTFLYEGQRLYATRRPLTDVRPNVVSSFADMRDWHLADGE